MNTEVHVVLATLSTPDPNGHPQSRRVDLVPAIYDLAPAIYDLDASPMLGARQLSPGEVATDLAEYIGTVMDDMLALNTTIVYQYATQWATKTAKPTAATSFSSDRTQPQLSDLYVRLLVDFSSKHPELIANMLAALLADNICFTANAPAFPYTLPS